MKSTVHSKRAVLDLVGASCTSCAITIEHVGRRLPGVSDIFVDRGTSTIQVEYDGSTEVLDRICEVVDRIGYAATVRATDSTDSADSSGAGGS